MFFSRVLVPFFLFASIASAEPGCEETKPSQTLGNVAHEIIQDLDMISAQDAAVVKGRRELEASLRPRFAPL